MKEFFVSLGFECHHPPNKEAVVSSMSFDLKSPSMKNWIPKGNSFLFQKSRT